MKQKVVSREYKVMLKKERFIGTQMALLERAGEFWSSFRREVQDIVYDSDGSLDRVEKRRAVKFYDGADRPLQEDNYVFRERVEPGTDKREVTLKFRHADRYITQDRDMAAADFESGRTKFEEDIKLPFMTLYSFSTKQSIPQGRTLDKLADLCGLYPGLKKRLKPSQEEVPLEIVRDFTASEVVIVGADFQIGKSPKVEAECGLIVWYDQAGDPGTPVVAEFSFRYEDEREEYDGEPAKRAYDVFGRLGDMDWVDAEGPTKTAFVY